MIRSVSINRQSSRWRENWRAARLIDFDGTLGLISVEHDGAIGWDELQDIKNELVGEGCVAIEVYPPADRVVNNLPMRHLWLLSANDWWPDLTAEGAPAPLTLQNRFVIAQEDNSRMPGVP